jgi:hypothetical protein
MRGSEEMSMWLTMRGGRQVERHLALGVAGAALARRVWGQAFTGRGVDSNPLVKKLW